jgi:hypothetical protein
MTETVVAKVTPSLTLMTSPSPSTVGKTVTVQLSVVGVSPTGSVTFFDGSTVLGSTSLNGSGSASVTTTGLAAGTHALSAVYLGDSNNSSAVSSSLNEVVSAISVPGAAAPPSGNLSATVFGTPTSTTVIAGVGSTTNSSSASGSASITVPAGALPPGTTVSVYPVLNAGAVESELPRGKTYLLSFAISWEAPDGTSPAATAPITMTVVSSSIKKGDTIFEATTTGVKAVGVATTNGRATVTFTNDPTFIVTATPNVSVATTTAAPGSGGIDFELKCATGAACNGTADLSVARRSTVGKRSVLTHLVLARAAVAIRAGGHRSVTFHPTAAGALVLGRSAPFTRFRITMLLTITGGVRAVHAAVLSSK